MHVDLEHKISEILTNPMEEYGKYCPESKNIYQKSMKFDSHKKWLLQNMPVSYSNVQNKILLSCI